ncbi:hypothetical protein NORO109296_16675 [Nocardiopsis rhodophaea]
MIIGGGARVAEGPSLEARQPPHAATPDPVYPLEHPASPGGRKRAPTLACRRCCFSPPNIGQVNADKAAQQTPVFRTRSPSGGFP